MWLVPTKKELNRELKNIKKGFKDRDDKIDKLREKIEQNSLKIATLEGSFLVLSNRSQVSVSHSSKKSQPTYETKLINRIRKSKKALIMAEMMKLINTHTGIEMFEIVVREKGLCSKASFYRYLASLKSQNLIETETELRQENK